MPTSPQPNGSSPVRVSRWPRRAAQRRSGDDWVAVEEPMEVRVDSRSVAVLMRTPGHDEELAAGFLLSEGVIRSAADIVAIRRHPRNRDGNVVDVFLAGHVRYDPARLTRHVFAASSCGMCGKAAIESMRSCFPRVRGDWSIEARVLAGLPSRMREAQVGFEASGGLHAAALFDRSGHRVALREDVGRHNAVDKLLGWALREGRFPMSEWVLMVSGRASFEILHKALAGGLPVVAAVSAPSSLAVEFARRNGQTLVGFLREDRFNVYSRPRRVVGCGSR